MTGRQAARAPASRRGGKGKRRYARAHRRMDVRSTTGKAMRQGASLAFLPLSHPCGDAGARATCRAGTRRWRSGWVGCETSTAEDESMGEVAEPSVFISYSWSSPEHEAWVVALAIELVGSGVRVILDKWDLRPGGDAHLFMERMVNDRAVSKVIMVCDKLYKDKADARRGGAGTEAQILSPELYSSRENSKFCAVAREVDDAGKPFLPTFYASRIYIDMSDDSLRSERLEEVIRWIFDKPLLVRPQLGPRPFYLDARDDLELHTSGRARRAMDAVRNHKPFWKAALQEYCTTLRDGFEKLRIPAGDDFAERFQESITAFLPYRNEMLSVVRTVAQQDIGEQMHGVLHRFFEELLPYTVAPKQAVSFYENQFDNFRYLIYELFLLTISSVLKAENFAVCDYLVNRNYFSSELVRHRSDNLVSYSVLQWQGMRTLEVLNSRLSQSFKSYRAHLVQARLEGSELQIVDVMQADLVLALLAKTREGNAGYWWPDTLLCGDGRYALPVFARCQSRAYYEKLKLVLGLEAEAFKKLVEEIDHQDGWFRGSFYFGPSVSMLVGAEKLCSAR